MEKEFRTILLEPYLAKSELDLFKFRETKTRELCATGLQSKQLLSGIRKYKL